MSWLVSLDQLQPDQTKAAIADTYSNRIVCGGPGSGKSVIMMHRAGELIKRYKLKPDSIRIFSYTKALSDYLGKAAEMLDIPEDCISTFDRWCYDYLRNRMKKSVPLAERRPDYDKVRAIVRQDVSSKFMKEYDVVLIDEAQDLSEDALFIVKAIAQHVTLFADPSQQIYETGSSLERIRQIFAIEAPNTRVLDLYRTSPFIAELAVSLMEKSPDRAEFLNNVRARQIERQKPLFYRAIDMKDEQGHLAEKIPVRLKMGDSVAVLFPQNKQAYGWARGMKEKGIHVEDPDSLDLSSQHPKFMTIHSAKGLTFDTVFMPKMTRKSFDNFSLAQQSNMLFVGITRARKWVCMSATGNEMEPLKQLFRNAPEAFTRHEPKDRIASSLFATNDIDDDIDDDDSIDFL